MGREILSLPAPPSDHQIAYGSDANQFGDLRLPPGKGPHAVAVVIHGGFWRAAFNREYAGHLAAALTARGLATWNIEYRRIGQNGGGYPGTLLDVSAAVDYLAQLALAFYLNLSTVIAAGHSAGGHLALWLASREKPKVRISAAVSIAGVCDLRAGWETRMGTGVVEEFLGGSPAQYPERYRAASPSERLPMRVPTRLVHGEKDDVVPISQAENFDIAARKAGDRIQLIRLPGVDHFDVMDPRADAGKRVIETILSLRK